MAVLNEGSTIKKSSGKEVIASIVDVEDNLSGKVQKNDFPIIQGTFTPTVRGGNVVGNHTYTTREGYYVTIGDLVIIFVNVEITTKDPDMNGGLYISGLPYTAAVAAGLSVGRFQNIRNIRKTTLNHVSAVIDNGSNMIRFFGTRYDTTSAGRVSIISDDVRDNFKMVVSGAYIKR